MTSAPLLPLEVAAWSERDVRLWLEGQNEACLQPHGALFERHGIDGRVLLSLSEGDLRLAPLAMERLGDIKKMTSLLKSLRSSAPSALATRHGGCHRSLSEASCASSAASSDAVAPAPLSDVATEAGTLAALVSDVATLGPCSEQQRRALNRLACAVAYCFLSIFATSFSLVLAHERVPLTDQYPPLPDVILDNFVRVPWAFAASEYAILFLAAVLLSIVITHKARVAIVTRLLAIAATVFLLRCVTMLSTSLSVPGSHLDCQQLRLPTFQAKLERALRIVCGVGSTIFGVETCGDYMFSGHAAGLTLFACFICEYTPTRWVGFHRAVWATAAGGMACILLAHEHYSIDVFIAFYISSRVFAYYHTLAEGMARMSKSQVQKLSLWFPMVAFFEKDAPSCGHSNSYDMPPFVKHL